MTMVAWSIWKGRTFILHEGGQSRRNVNVLSSLRLLSDFQTTRAAMNSGMQGGVMSSKMDRLRVYGNF